MSNSDRDNQWIIRIGNWYLAHPRGEWAREPGTAYGYHYKGGKTAKNQGAEEEAERWRQYTRRLVSNSDVVPPGMLPPSPTGFNSRTTIDVMRRKDAKPLPGGAIEVIRPTDGETWAHYCGRSPLANSNRESNPDTHVWSVRHDGWMAPVSGSCDHCGAPRLGTGGGECSAGCAESKAFDHAGFRAALKEATAAGTEASALASAAGWKHEYSPVNGHHRIVAPDGNDSGWCLPMTVATMWHSGAWHVAFADPYAIGGLINVVWRLGPPINAHTHPVVEGMCRSDCPMWCPPKP